MWAAGAADDLAGVDADADLEPVAQPGDGLPDGERRPKRALGVVVVRLRRAEQRHHRVADVLLDAPAVALDLGRDRAEVRALEVADLFGVAGLGTPGEADEVGEEHAHEPPLVADRHVRILPIA